MNRIIKNRSRNVVHTVYNGKEVIILPKGSLEVRDHLTGEHLAEYLLETYHFLYDATPKANYPVGKATIAKGVKVR